MENYKNITSGTDISVKKVIDSGDFLTAYKFIHKEHVPAPTKGGVCLFSFTEVKPQCDSIYCSECAFRSNSAPHQTFKNGGTNAEIFKSWAQGYKLKNVDLIGELQKYSLPLAQLAFERANTNNNDIIPLVRLQQENLRHLFLFLDTPEGFLFWNGVANGEYYELPPNNKQQLTKELIANIQPPFKGEIKNFPPEVVRAMVTEQVAQGNPMDITVFEKDKTCGGDKGFVWTSSKDGNTFWSEIIMHGNFYIFYDKYPPTAIKHTSPPTIDAILVKHNIKANYNYQSLKFKNNGKFTHL